MLPMKNVVPALSSSILPHQHLTHVKRIVIGSGIILPLVHTFRSTRNMRDPVSETMKMTMRRDVDITSQGSHIKFFSFNCVH